MPKTAMNRAERTPVTEQLQQGKFLSVREGAAFSKVSEITLRRWLTQKKLRRYKIGSRTLIKASDLAGLIHEAK